MKYISSVLTLSLVSLLSACGGGDSNYSVHTSDIGFSDESNSNGGNKPNPPITEDLQKTFNSLKTLYTTNFTEPLSYQGSAFLKLPKFP